MTLRICVLSDPMSHRRHSRASWNTVSRSTTSLDRSSTAWTCTQTTRQRSGWSESIVNVIPSPVAVCKDVPIGKDGGEKDESVGAGSVEPDCGPRDLIIQSYIPGNPNGQNASGGQNGNGQASGNGRNTTISGGYGNTSVPSGGSAVATGSMTNIMALNDRGEVVANLMINTMPSWQRYDEGKVEIHNGGGGGRSTGNGNLGNGGGLAAFVNYQCAPTCRRVPDPAENASSATSGTETSTTVINSR